ncbi:ScbR family autoregulator-binding transcription factor [Rhodococcus maanshanensis]|uniref:DNA-binding transcriptional regulator, AcrR family n=1 Tax=Rhodococcus maanshanensis TaxID=183556 RepID=A0A1H7MKI4_9NOCA|nr:ScbR family autoregulator-binding transcription factor [Rhodococcus maanshanensis]SEL11674.1 DNA-binding transcriptional regulator, AcrR family [Rhodococcus maanshanensis]
MVRQERAEATRKAVLGAAANVFARFGYANANLSEIIAESGVTKGSLYFHFASKEELARGVIDEGNSRVIAACAPLMDIRDPALETMIGLSYLVTDVAATDPIVAAMLRLHHEIGDHRGTGDNLVEFWQRENSNLVKRAIAEGDITAEAEADAIATFIFDALFGGRVAASATGSAEQLPARMESTWSFILTSLVPATKVGYFREFTLRRSRR